MKSNLSKLEENGLRWLQNKVSANELSVCQADKGGAILLVSPEFLMRKIEEKVTDDDLYEKMEEDPRPMLGDGLFEKWKYGKEAKFISDVEAEKRKR